MLVNNAGVGGMADVETETVEGWNRVVGINQQGVWLGMRAVGAMTRLQGSGSIVNVSSVLGHTGGRGDMFAYHATKGAVLAMTKNAAVLWGRDGVRVNTVDPGFVETPSEWHVLDVTSMCPAHAPWLVHRQCRERPGARGTPLPSGCIRRQQGWRAGPHAQSGPGVVSPQRGDASTHCALDISTVR